MLEAVGVGPGDEEIYRTLLGAPHCTLADLAERTGRDAHSVQAAVDRLEELGLLRRSADHPPCLVPARPDVAVDVLAARRRAELDHAQAAARSLLAEMRTDEQYRPENLVEVVVGRQAIAARFAQLLQGTTDELLVLDRPPYVAPVDESGPAVRTLLRDGVEVLGIYSSDSLEPPGAVDEAYSASDAGEISRAHPRVPMKLAIADRTSALLPLAMDQLVDSALVVHRSALLDALVELFFLLWEQSLPVVPKAGSAPDDGSLDDRLLTMLAAGLKDNAVARHLGLSNRTVSRRVGVLMDRLGARTRFQAGAHAQARHLLDGAAPRKPDQPRHDDVAS